MRRVLLVVALTCGLAGCAGTADQSPQGTPGTASSATSATSSPGPVPTPSTSVGVVVGSVTADSGGPCYLVETDDGKQYALIGNGGTVHRGQRVRAQIEQRPTAVDCGPGIQLAFTKLETS